jgi:superfamily II DNA/RNA helicase
MTKSFADLGLPADLVAALADQGITQPFAIQQLTIEDALAGRDVLGKAKTGSGKTLAFGLPMLGRVTEAEPRRPHGLILVPTRELATQVTEALAPLGKGRGLEVRAVYGGVSMDPQVEALRKASTSSWHAWTSHRPHRAGRAVGAAIQVLVSTRPTAWPMGFMPQVQKISTA